MIDYVSGIKKDIDNFYNIFSIASKREVIKEIGDYIYTDDNDYWCVAYNNGKVVGFCSAFYKTKNTIEITNSYIIPEFRGKDIYGEMFELVREWALGQLSGNKKGKIFLITKNKRVIKTASGYNMKVVSKNGRWERCE